MFVKFLDEASLATLEECFIFLAGSFFFLFFFFGFWLPFKKHPLHVQQIHFRLRTDKLGRKSQGIWPRGFC